MKDYYVDNRLTITANAILESIKILENIERGGIAASLELTKSVQSSVKELCTLLLHYVEN